MDENSLNIRINQICYRLEHDPLIIKTMRVKLEVELSKLLNQRTTLRKIFKE